ncbi:MAG: hypothetical protein MJA27_32235 [Pseudanabaenales cyanobacterium]|nr:hypothetical protein [Pseudanabaenales cyanobacterium]
MHKAVVPSHLANPIENWRFQLPTLPVSSELLISLATGPMLLGILSAKSLSEFGRQIGLASEEMFRGDRLPVLKMPISGNENNHDS